MPRAQVSSKAAFLVQLTSAPDQELVELRDFCTAVLVGRKKSAGSTAGVAQGPETPRVRKVSAKRAAAASAKAAEITGAGRKPSAAPAAEVLT